MVEERCPASVPWGLYLSASLAAALCSHRGTLSHGQCLGRR